MNRQQLQKELKVELEKEGFKVELLKQWPARITYYKKDGEPMPNLPADPFSMERYRRKGFGLVPPKGAHDIPKTRAKRKPRETINDITDKGEVVSIPLAQYKESLKQGDD